MKTLIVVLALFITNACLAQLGSNVKLDRGSMKSLLQKEFASMYTSTIKNGLGTFAEIDLTNTKVDFSGNLVFDNGSVLGLKASGGVSDGIFSVFSNTKWNSNMSLNISYNFLGNKILKKDGRINSITYSAQALREIQAKEREAMTKYRIDSLKAKQDLAIKKLNMDIQKLEKQKKILEDTLKGPNRFTDYMTDTTLVKILELSEAIKNKNSTRANLQPGKVNLRALQVRGKTLGELKNSLNIEAFRMGWFSISAGLKNNSFKRFDPSADYAEQISKDSYLSPEFSVQYSFYNKSLEGFKTVFASLYIKGSLKDNFSSLSKKEINEKTEHGSNPGDRYTYDKYTAYAGAYKKDIGSITIGSDVYWFLFSNNLAAIHFYPIYQIAEDLQPESNFGTGFYMSFKNKKEDKSPVNAEIFANLTNLFQMNNPRETNLFKRSTYGMRFTFPIKFN